MSSTNQPQDPAKRCLLEVTDLHNQTEFDELLRQRIACGWRMQPSDIEGWRKMIDDKTMAMFWIVPPHLAVESAPARWVGHIAMQSSVVPEDLEVANPDKSIMGITTLFVRLENRHGGLGRAAIQELEAYAKLEPYGSPDCKMITVETRSRKYTEYDGDEWRGIYAKRGMETPVRGTSTEDWYARLGYKTWKEKPAYREKLLDGTEILLIKSSMRKALQ